MRRLIAIFLAILLILPIAYSQFTPPAGGYAVLSISNVDLIDYETHVKDKAWLITLVQNQMSDIAYGQFSADQIVDDKGNKAERAFALEITNDEQTCVYRIRADQIIYHAEWRRFDLTTLEKLRQDYTRAKQECDAWVDEIKGAYGYKTSVAGKVYCLRLVPEGWHGTLSTPTLNFKSTLKLYIEGLQPISATISSTEQTEVTFPNNLAYARWVGSLSTGEYCPTRDIPDAFFGAGQYWYLIDANEYKSYKSKLDTILNCWASVNTDTTAQTCVDELNNRLLIMAKPVTFESPTYKNKATVSGKLTNGVVSLPLKKMIQFPVFNLFIKASTLGIIQPYGVPKIVDASSEPFNPNTGYGYISVTVRNDGSAPGSFATYANCPSPVSALRTEYFKPLNPGESATTTITIVAQPSGKSYSVTCEVVVYDRKKPTNKDSTTVIVTVNPLIVCNEGDTRCNGNVVEKCVNNAWTPQYTCEYTCGYTNGKADCIAKPPVYKCKWYDIPCKLSSWIRERVSSIILTLVLTILILGLLLAFLLRLIPILPKR